jgi:hypothetical protein
MAESAQVATPPQQGWTPVPDPTTLTTEALRREVAGLKELLETRLDAMDRAVEVFDANLNKVPTETDLKVGQLREVVYETFKTIGTEIDGLRLLTKEQFRGIELQFTERDTRTRDTAAQGALALTAALAAQKEAVAEQNKSFEKSIDKSERSTTEQITQQSILLQTTGSSLNEKIVALDNRMTRFEGLGLGAQTAENTARLNSGLGLQTVGIHTQQNSLALALTGLAVTFLLGSAGIVIALLAHHP